jgi:hypothetical protein
MSRKPKSFITPGELEHDILATVFGHADGGISRDILDDRILAKCQAHWADLTGNLSQHSFPVRVRGDRMDVLVEKAVYRQEFQLFGTDILKRINVLTGGALRQIRADPGRITYDVRRPDQPGGYRPVLRKAPADFNEGQRALLDGLVKMDTML